MIVLGALTTRASSQVVSQLYTTKAKPTPTGRTHRTKSLTNTYHVEKKQRSTLLPFSHTALKKTNTGTVPINHRTADGVLRAVNYVRGK